MKRIITILTCSCLIFVCSNLDAQTKFWVGGGYGQAYGPIKNLNFVIDRYNETRSFLSTEMKHLELPGGGVVNAGYIGKRYSGFIGWSGRNQRVWAEGVDATGFLVRRELKLRINTFDIGGGYTILRSRVFAFSTGFIFHFGRTSGFTRVGREDGIKEVDWGDRILKRGVFGNSFYMDFSLSFGKKMGGMLIFRPNIMAVWTRPDFASVNNAINPATAGADPVTLKSIPWNVGAQVILAFFISTN